MSSMDYDNSLMALIHKRSDLSRRIKYERDYKPGEKEEIYSEIEKVNKQIRNLEEKANSGNMIRLW